MTSVGKRRSSRKSGGRRKHSNGALSDASSTGSFLDETDREVSSLTDRAFRSLCIGDEAVYNDSDLNTSSPCFQSDRQSAFSQGGPDGEREEIKRAAQQSFSLRTQQYELNWVQGGMYGAQVRRDPQYGLYGESEPLSATFQRSYVTPSQQEAPPRNMELSCLSNGATEFSLQQRRSRSRVSSLIQAFNTEGYMEGAGSDGKFREWNDQGVWDRSALISIQTDLAQFSMSHQQPRNNSQFPPVGPFSFKDSTLYPSEVAAMAHINAESSFVSPSHSTSTQDICNSNVFIHSEFSPFRVWKHHNHFPLQHGDVSKFLNSSEFSQWYETPMYKKLSLESQCQGLYHFQERDNRYPRNNSAPVVPPTAFHSAVPQKAASVEKRCESELAGYHPHWKGPESLGANRLPPQRPSTASPATEMSRRVQDTISSVKAFQQKIKMMTEQSTAEVNKHEGFISNNNLFYGNEIQTEAPTVNSNASTTPFSISQLLTPFIPGNQDEATSGVTQHPVSPQPVEHPPVRAESRGANPDARMSSYKSRATSLLFNLKDNRKRVKSTYSPNKFKASEAPEKNKHQAVQEPRDTVIDIPDDPEPDVPSSAEDSSRANIVSYQYEKQRQTTGFSGTMFNSPPGKEPREQCLQNKGNYQTSHTQGTLLHHPGVTGFMVENYTSNQVANGQIVYEDLSFAPCKQGMMNNAECQGGDRHRFRPSYSTTETPRTNPDNNQTGEYLISKANPEQHFNETVGRESTKVKHNYSNASSQNRWRQANNQDAENICLKTAISPWKQEITSLMEKDKHTQESQRAAVIKEELNIQTDGGSGENQQSRNHEREKKELRKNGAKNTLNISNQWPAHYSQQQQQQHHKVFEDKLVLSYDPDENERNDMMKNYLHQDFGTQRNIDLSKYECIFVCGGDEKQGNESSLQAIVAKPQFKQETLKKPLSNPDNASAPATANQPAHSQAGQATEEHRKAQHAQAELAEAQNKAQEEQCGAETDQIILAERASSHKVEEGQTKTELKEHKRVQQDVTQHAQDKSESSTEQWTKTEQTTTNQPKHVTEESGAKHRGEPQGETVNQENIGAGRLQEEHIKTEQTRAKQVQTEHSSRETPKAELGNEKQESEQGEVEQIRMENVQAGEAAAESRKIDHATGAREHEKPKADEGAIIPEGRVKQPTTQKGHRGKMEAKKTESPRLEHKKLELAKSLLLNTEDMLETYAKPAAKLKIDKKMKSEPDKVEQVKTELAKAKAELAKIKDKMREEQKEKARNTAPTKDDGKDLMKGIINKKEEQKHQEEAAENHQQSQDSAFVSRKNQANSGTDDYERLRQKYGFTNTTSVNKNKMPAAENVLPSDNSKARSLSPNEFAMRKHENSKDKNSSKSRFASVKTENKRQEDSLKPSEGTETPYVYSESSKEFKLLNDCLLSDKMKDSSVQKREKCDSVKHVLKQGSSDLVKVLPRDRKTKSGEHSLGPANEPLVTPVRSLSHKERAQTKQEILTSRIKAHAEKEISAIKESLAKPDGLLFKTFSKSAGVSQKLESQSQELSNKHEKNTVRMQQVEPSGAQMKSVRSVSPTNSMRVPDNSATTDSELIDPPKVPKENITSNTVVSEKPVQAKQTDIIIANEDIDGTQSKKPALGSPVKEHILKNKEEQEQGEIAGKKKKDLEENSASQANQPNNNVDLLETNVLNEVDKPKCAPREKAEEDSKSSLKIVLGSNETAANDDSLQIMGIMVTVRERTPPPVSNDQRKNNADENMTLKETEPSSVEGNKCHLSVGGEVIESLKSGNALDGLSTIREDQTRAGMNNHLETVKETSLLASENVKEKCTNIELKDSARPQRETLSQEPLPEEGVSCTLPAKNKEIDVNKPQLHKQDTSTESKHDEKNSTPTTHANDNFHAKPQIQSDSQPSLKEEMVINTLGSLYLCGQISPLQEEQSHDPKAVMSFKERAPHQRTENQHKCPETHVEENTKEDKVHIDSIAIRVLPAEAMDNPDTAHEGKGKILKTEEKIKVSVPARREKESKDSQDDQSGNVSSMKMPDLIKGNKQQNSIKSDKVMSESKIEPMEWGYFQMQGVIETNVKPQNQQNTEQVCEQALPGLKNTAICTEGKNEVFALEQAEMKTLESCSESIENENMETKMRETSYNVPLIQSGSPSEVQGVGNVSTDVHRSAYMAAQQRPSSSVKESLRSQNQLTMSESVKEKQEVKPKMKVRASTIPEISAIADYARLKVIVSEDREIPIQEFPPHKKEGFFPLIQSRHSRRPVFTVEPQTPAVKEKCLPSKPEIRAEVNKEPKPLVFPITEKEHQRTGMFKLGDKEKQEKNTVVAKEKHADTSRNPDKCASIVSVIEAPQLTQHLHPQTNMKQMDGKDKINGSHLAKTEEEIQGTWRQEEIGRKRGNQPEEVQAPPRKLEDKTGEIKIKQIIVESRASLEEEERRASQREEERRAWELEAKAILIKQRREKQREAERRAEEERQAKQMEEERRKIREQEVVKSVEEQRAKFEEEKQKIKMEDLSRLKNHGEDRVALAEHQGKDTHLGEHQWRAAEQDQQSRTAQEEQLRRAEAQEKLMRAAQEQQQRRATEKDQQRRAAQEELRRAEAQEKLRAAQEEQQRRATEQDQQRRAAQEEQLRRAEAQEKLRAAQEEHQRRATEQDQQRRAAQEEQLRRAEEHGKLGRADKEEQQRRAAEQDQRRRAAQEERQRRAEAQHRQMRAAQEEQQQRAEEQDHKRRAFQEEQLRRAAPQEQHRRDAYLEELVQKQAAQEQRRATEQEPQSRAAEQNEHRRGAHEEQLRKFQLEEHQRRAAHEEQQRRAAHLEELQMRTAQEESRRKAAYEEQQRRAKREKQQLQASQLGEQRQVVQKEDQNTAVGGKELHKRGVEGEQQRTVAEAEAQQCRVAQEVQWWRDDELKEQQRRSAKEEQQKRAAINEHQIRTAHLEEQQRRAAIDKHQKRTAYVEQRRVAAFEEQQLRTVKEEQQKRAEYKNHRRMTEGEEMRIPEQEEQQTRAAEEKQQHRAVNGNFQEQRVTAEKDKQNKAVKDDDQMKTAQVTEQQRQAAIEELQNRAPPEEQHCKTAKVAQQQKAAKEEHLRGAAEIKKLQRSPQQDQQIISLTEQQRQAEPNISVGEKNKTKWLEERSHAQTSERSTNKQIQSEIESQTVGMTDRRQNREVWMQTQEEEGQRVVHKEKTIIKERDTTEAKVDKSKTLGERHSAVKDEKRAEQEQMSDQRNCEITVKETDEEKEMFAAYREKERAAQTEHQKTAAQLIDALQYYTIASAETERKAREWQPSSPVLPQRRNHLSALESSEDPHIKLYRPQAPLSPALSLPRSNTSSPALGNKPSMFRVKDNTLRGSSFVKSVKPRFHKSFGDDFIVGSHMGSERAEEEQDALRSSAVTPLHLDRVTAIKDSFPSAYSSNGSLGAPPQSRPYNRRSIALDEDDSRSVFSIMSEDVESFATSATDLADVRALYEYERPDSSCSFSSDMSRSLGKPPVVPPKSEKALRRAKRLTTRRIRKELTKAAENGPEEGSALSSSSSIEVQSSSRTTIATPHSSPPVSLAYAPKQGSSLPPSHTEHRSSLPATPSVTGPISLPAASPHVTTPVSLPAASPHAIGPVPHATAPKTIANVPSSPTLHHTSHQAPVAKYQFESSYPNPYPLTQRKVLQDVGSGQYFVVDMPVQVKTKTFFDPETGRYVQLNVRESARRPSQSQLQLACPPPQLQPQSVNLQQELHCQDLPAAKPDVFHQGYNGHPQGYQPAEISAVPHSRSSVPGTVYQDQQTVRDNPRCVPASGEENYNNSEKTPYMDTVSNADRNYNTLYHTLESFPDCEANSQLAGSSVYKNDNSAHSQYGSRDIITMSELEDFMELSDW